MINSVEFVLRNSQIDFFENPLRESNSISLVAKEIFEEFLNSSMLNSYDQKINKNFLEAPVQTAVKEIFLQKFGSEKDICPEMNQYLRELAMVKRVEYLSDYVSEEEEKELGELSIQELYEELKKLGLPREFPEKFQIARMGGSTTIIDQSAESMRAKDNWLKADAYVRELVEKDQSLTLENILQLNAILGKGLINNQCDVGELRSFEVLAGGNKSYLPSSMVHGCMEGFVKWVNLEMENHTNPIVLAAKAYQRLVSIHPFSDANGRTTRLVMDFILMRDGLPPSVLEDVEAAIFALEETNNTPRMIIGKVYNGLIKSMCDYGLYSLEEE